MALATWRAAGRYHIRAAQPVDPLESLWDRLAAEAGGGQVLLGFDFPIGLPAVHAARAGITDFPAALERFDERFYAVAERAGEIAPGRPFYPMRPGGCRRQQLLDGLGLDRWSDLLRRCDRGSRTRPAACALFGTRGGSQVGKAAIAGWRDLLAPAVRAGVDLGLWPFQGRLDLLLRQHRFVVAETYPGEVYGHLGLALRRDGGKRSQRARRGASGALLARSRALGIEAAAARVEIEDGFGGGADGEDRFDAMVGLVGMLQVVLGERASGEPDDPAVTRIEGWILGQRA
jgi:hypothetical protein